VPAREPLKACTSQPRISGYLARTHYLGPEGDGHPVALADITQCDNSSITSISDRRIGAQVSSYSQRYISVQIVRFGVTGPSGSSAWPGHSFAGAHAGAARQAVGFPARVGKVTAGEFAQ
jgi:hypothetical protein